MDELGYPNFVMTGKVAGAYGTLSHAWNVLYRGSWYHSDATDTKYGDYSTYMMRESSMSNYTWSDSTLSILASSTLDAYESKEYSGDPLTYTLQEDGSYWVTDCAVGVTSVTIPAQYQGAAVTGIGEYAFQNCSWLEEIDIPEGVTTIGAFAFDSCIGLTEIALPSTVTSLGAGAFYKCISLKRANLSASRIPTISTYTFQYCISLKEVCIPETTSSISISICQAAHRMDGASSITVYGLTGSPAQTYAENCGYPFVSTGTHTNSYTAQVTTAPTCTETGVTTYTCSCGDSYTETISATGHTPGEAVQKNVVEATATETGSYDSVVYCTVCGAELSRETVTVPATGTGDSGTGDTGTGDTGTGDTGTGDTGTGDTGTGDTGTGDTGTGDSGTGDTGTGDTGTGDSGTGHTHAYTSAVTKDATCGENGVMTYTCSCGDSYTETIPATGHSWNSGTVTTAATCTTDGVMTYTCSECGASYTESIPATGHTWDKGTVTLKATRYTEGEKTYICTVCGATKTETIAVLTGSDAEFLFGDVSTETSSNNWYYKAVYWACDMGVTNGTSDTTFSPTQGCTRAQFATFLYRLAGEPEPQGTENPFSDVKNSGADAVYYNAILWAYDNGITNGTSDTTFDPGGTITRAQAVTMLYRYATMVNGGTAPTVSTSNIFSDVKNSGADEVYYTPILWAVQCGITNGTDATKFSPGDTCDRAMMVTYLYRYAVEPLTTA